MPAFDIFTGESDKDAVWMESVSGLGNANTRTRQIAAENPGKYFLLSQETRLILARLDTSAKQQSKSNPEGNATCFEWPG